jgi:hypothetical protein
MTTAKRMSLRKHSYWQPSLAFLVVLLLGLAGCGGAAAPDETSSATERQELIATRGVEVMPFDLERTTHIFEKREDGGLQQVVADEPDDEEQIRLIREHLLEEAERFREGDFHDPAMIHGDDMAGLHELMLGAGRITIVYSELPDGAQILYTTGDTGLVSAIHGWFDAQLADHGAHTTERP